MLVLTRKLQQQIQVGDNITITILRVSGKTVRVGIQAPRDMRVVRAELPRRDTAVAADSSAETSDEDRTRRRSGLNRSKRRVTFPTTPASQTPTPQEKPVPPIGPAPGGPRAEEASTMRCSPAPVASSTLDSRTPERLGPLSCYGLLGRR